MANKDDRRRGLQDRWSQLEQVKRRTPSSTEVISAIAEQVRIEDELQSLDDTRSASDAR